MHYTAAEPMVKGESRCSYLLSCNRPWQLVITRASRCSYHGHACLHSSCTHPGVRMHYTAAEPMVKGESRCSYLLSCNRPWQLVITRASRCSYHGHACLHSSCTHPGVQYALYSCRAHGQRSIPVLSCNRPWQLVITRTSRCSYHGHACRHSSCTHPEVLYALYCCRVHGQRSWSIPVLVFAFM